MKKTQKLTPKDINIYRYLGYCYMMMKDYTSSIKLDEELKKSNGNNYHLRMQMKKDPDLANIRETKEYKELEKKYK